MKSLTIIILICVLFYGCSDSLSIDGNWKNGTNELKLSKDNNYILLDSGSVKLKGLYALVFDKVQFINSGNDLALQCMKPGRYTFTLLNDSLQLTMQDDPCTERKFMLNGVYWEKSHE